MPRNTLAAFDLKAARKVRGLSQMKVAEILCTSQPSIARWEAVGNMPAIYRKAWDLHWQLETLGDKPNDSRSNKRNRKSGSRIRKVARSKAGNDRSNEGSQASSAAGTTESAEPIRET